MLRGDVYGIDLSGAIGHDQRGKRFVVVVQSDQLYSSTTIVCPTSSIARATSYRPEVEVQGATTRVLCEHVQAVDVTRLKHQVGRLTLGEMAVVGEALAFLLELA